MIKNEIKLYSDLLIKVKEGKKKATLRLGIKEYVLGPSLLISSEDRNDSITIFITELSVIRLSEITPKIAKNVGYTSTARLKQKMFAIYPDLTNESFLTYVKFTKN